MSRSDRARRLRRADRTRSNKVVARIEGVFSRNLALLDARLSDLKHGVVAWPKLRQGGASLPWLP